MPFFAKEISKPVSLNRQFCTCALPDRDKARKALFPFPSSNSLDHRTTFSHVVERKTWVNRIPLDVQIFEAWEVLEHADIADPVVADQKVIEGFHF